MELAGALEFIAHPYAAAAHSAAARTTEAVRDTSTLLRVRALLAGHHVAKPSAAYLARAFGMSTRTLYRELRRTGTTFADEVRRARDGTRHDLAA
jgi:AraC-like DNA-binding protein